MAGVGEFFDGHILDKSGEEIDLNDKKYKGKVIGLYFGAHWCAPCRAFTPILADFYKKYHKQKKFEIIFISLDNDDGDFDDYYKEMPWWTLDYSERDKQEELQKTFEVVSVPKLILFDGNSGDILCDDAKDQIKNQDPQGEYFPWNDTEEADDEDEDE